MKLKDIIAIAPDAENYYRINKLDTNMDLDEAFQKMLNTRLWYSNHGISRSTAYSVKKRFENKQLSDESKRFYLIRCGWTVREMWKEPTKKISSK